MLLFAWNNYRLSKVRSAERASQCWSICRGIQTIEDDFVSSHSNSCLLNILGFLWQDPMFSPVEIWPLQLTAPCCDGAQPASPQAGPGVTEKSSWGGVSGKAHGRKSTRRNSFSKSPDRREQEKWMTRRQFALGQKFSGAVLII